MSQKTDFLKILQTVRGCFLLGLDGIRSKEGQVRCTCYMVHRCTYGRQWQVLCTFVLGTTIWTTICTFETFKQVHSNHLRFQHLSTKHAKKCTAHTFKKKSLQSHVLLVLVSNNHRNHKYSYNTFDQSHNHALNFCTCCCAT